MIKRKKEFTYIYRHALSIQYKPQAPSVHTEQADFHTDATCLSIWLFSLKSKTKHQQTKLEQKAERWGHNHSIWDLKAKYSHPLYFYHTSPGCYSRSPALLLWSIWRTSTSSSCSLNSRFCAPRPGDPVKTLCCTLTAFHLIFLKSNISSLRFLNAIYKLFIALSLMITW